MGGLEPKCIDRHTFAAYRRGKAQACNLLRLKPDLRADITIFYKKDASQEELLLQGNASSLPGMVLRRALIEYCKMF